MFMKILPEMYGQGIPHRSLEVIWTQTPEQNRLGGGLFSSSAVVG